MLETRPREAAICRRLVITSSARRRLAEACRDVLEDALSFGPLDLPRPRDRELIGGTVASAAEHASLAALETLATEVADALERAPDRVLERIAASRREERVRIELAPRR
jgi:hypothetical protein